MTTGRTRAFGRPVMVVQLGDQADRAVVDGCVGAAERCNRDTGTRVGRVDETSTADVHADVPEAVEEDEVAGPEMTARDAVARRELRHRVVRQRDAKVRVDEA